MELVTNFRGQLLDTDPNFGQYWHFLCTIIGVSADRNQYKGVFGTISDKDVVLWVGFILKVIMVQEILVPPNTSKLGFGKIIFKGV